MGTVIFWIIFWIVIAVIAFCPLYFIFLFIVGLFVDMNKEYEHDSRFYRFLLTNSTGVAAKLIRIRVKVTGRELLPKDTRYLLVCNHRSKFDPILSWLVFGDQQLAFISKPENFKVPVFGSSQKCFHLPDHESEYLPGPGLLWNNV